jgi:putative nucleotidyltransferase with HDIG domain
MPEAVDAFIEVSRRESFWFDARDAVTQTLLEDTLSRDLYLDCEDLLGLGKLFSQAVDFRNSFTASHSPGVASVADTLAELCGFSRDELVAIRLAGLLHDIGKLAITEAVLEKSGQLTAEESEKMKSHAYYTNRLLLKIREFDTIRSWASLHHERLDGSGYPYRLKGESLPLGSRILAVADVFVALTEDRPYRTEMNRTGLTGILESMANKGALDRNLVRLLLENYDRVDDCKRAEQKLARLEYDAFCIPDCSEAAAFEDVRLRRMLMQAPG